MTLYKILNLYKMKGERICRNCGRDISTDFTRGIPVWRNTGSGRGRTVRYYCDDCKQDLFEGVKLR